RDGRRNRAVVTQLGKHRQSCVEVDHAAFARQQAIVLGQFSNRLVGGHIGDNHRDDLVAFQLANVFQAAAAGVNLEQIDHCADVRLANHADQRGQRVECVDELESTIATQLGSRAKLDAEPCAMLGNRIAQFGQAAAVKLKVFVIRSQI